MTLLFISGTGGPRPAVGMALSSTLTAALPAFTKALAPVRVNLTAGFVDTPLSASLLGDNLETLDDRPKGLAILERIRTFFVMYMMEEVHRCQSCKENG